MPRKVSIFAKVFGSHIVVGGACVIALSLASYFIFQNALIQRTLDQLSSINTLKRTRIEDYFRATRRNMEQRLAGRDILLVGKRGEHQPISDALEKLVEYYDVRAAIIATSDGRVVAGSPGDSLLRALAAVPGDDQPITRFRILETSAYKPQKTVLVYVLPVLVSEQHCLLFIEDEFQKIQNMLLEITGMGSTGESYLVGSDFRMRSSSRFYPDKPAHSILVETDPARSAFAKQSLPGETVDYRGVRVLSVSSKLDSELNWVLISEIDFAEATLPLQRWKASISIAAAVILLVIVVVTYFIANSISNPILYLKRIVKSLSVGVIPSEKVVAGGTAEIKQIGEAIHELVQGLKRTTQFADETGSGNFYAPFTALGEGDTLGQALVRMRDRLRALSDTQIEAERARASALVEGQELERKRIVLELHDGVGQLLTAIRLRLGDIKSDQQSIKDLAKLVNETIDEVRRISYNLMPSVIVDFGLEAALKGLAVSIQKSSGTPVDFQYVKEFDHALSFEISIGVYRIVQEGLNNIVKHAAATLIELHVLENEHELYVLLRDNGRGFLETSDHSPGFGLRSMKERATLLRGTVEIHSVPGKGTEVEATIPIPHSPDGS